MVGYSKNIGISLVIYLSEDLYSTIVKSFAIDGFIVVGVAGLEPATSSSQTKRASQLR